MAEPSPFQPTLDDLQAIAAGQPGADLVSRGYAIGSDIQPRYGIKGPPPAMAMPWWLTPLAFMAGIRRQAPAVQTPPFQAAQMGSVAPRRMMSANDNSRDPNAVPMPLLNTGNQSTLSVGRPENSHVGKLARMSPQQFQVYRDARSRGMTPQQAMVAAMGE